MSRPLPVAEAQRRIHESSSLVGSETVALGDALGRVLRAEVLAQNALPPFDQSAMDGYALRSADTAPATEGSPVRLGLVGETAAGARPAPRLEAGQALRIMTGAPLPGGADAVVMQEHVQVSGDVVTVECALAPEQNVRRAGEDIEAGALALPAGTRLDARCTALMASLGAAAPNVSRRLRVAIVVTGSELVDVSAQLAPGQIRDSNCTLLTHLAEEASVHVVHVARCADDMTETRNAFKAALDARVDMLLVSGGVSVGDYDFTREALTALGVRELFWRVAQKPGKPLYYGVQGHTQVFGMPGNPGAVYLCFQRYVAPAIALREGIEWPWPEPVAACTTGDIQKRPGRALFCRGTVHADGGQLYFAPSTGQGSHMISRMTEGNALAVLPVEDDGAPAGAAVWVLPSHWGRGMLGGRDGG